MIPIPVVLQVMSMSQVLFQFMFRVIPGSFLYFISSADPGYSLLNSGTFVSNFLSNLDTILLPFQKTIHQHYRQFHSIIASFFDPDSFPSCHKLCPNSCTKCWSKFSFHFHQHRFCNIVFEVLPKEAFQVLSQMQLNFFNFFTIFS